MSFLEQFFFLSFLVQIGHSIEELSTGFHKKWYLFKMPFWVFLAFEICFILFWATILLFQNFPFRENLLAFFIVLMFANGIQHVVWWGMVKKYVPGLITAFMHVVVFLIFFFKTVL